MIFFHAVILLAVGLAACDLQPKIAALSDNIGMFIEDRYPALLADPNTQPEIYNSAVTDYGVYASPELYGSENIDDYVLYASIDDYVLVPEPEKQVSKIEKKPDNKAKKETQPIQTKTAVKEEKQDVSSTDIEEESEEDEEYLIVPLYGGADIIEEETKTSGIPDKDGIVTVVRGDTLYSIARKNNISVADLAKINELKEPYTLRIGQKLKTQIPVKVKEEPNVISEEKVNQIRAAAPDKKAEVAKPKETTRVNLEEITVEKGDTLYSISRKYQIPVNDLAVINKLSAPFNLAIGQKLKVSNLDNVKTKTVTEVKTEKKQPTKVENKPENKKVNKSKVEPKKTTTIQPAQKRQKTIKKSEVKTAQTKSVQQKTQKPAKKTNDVAKQQSTKITARSSSKFSWPVRGKILSGYGSKNNGLFNDGINISAARGTIVKAAENGIVAYAGNEVKGMGNLIIIQHSDGWMSVYAHLDSMLVRRGTKVSVGQSIGKIGMTGKVDKPQLHFEIRKGTKAYNPITYLKK